MLLMFIICGIFGDFELLPKLVTTEFFGIPEDERSCDLLVGHNINMTPEKWEVGNC